jgi:hypothetical protein
VKEIAVRFTDGTAKQVKVISEQIGLTPEELVKYIVGMWVREEMSSHYGPVASMVLQSIPSLSDFTKPVYLGLAEHGDLKCKNCTLSLTKEDVEKGTCHSCNAPIDFNSIDNK